MITDELAAILLRHPGVEVVISTPDSIDPIATVESDCFEVEQGPVIVLEAGDYEISPELRALAAAQTEAGRAAAVLDDEIRTIRDAQIIFDKYGDRHLVNAMQHYGDSLERNRALIQKGS